MYWTPKEMLPLFGLSDTSTNLERRRAVIIVSFVFLVAVAVTAMNGTFLDTKDQSSLNLKKHRLHEGHYRLTLRNSPVNKAKNNLYCNNNISSYFFP